MVIVPDRAGPTLAAKLKLTVPLPTPLPVTPVIHDADVDAVHGHAPLLRVKEVLDVPALAPTLVEAGTLAVQPDAWFTVSNWPPALSTAERAGPTLAA